ncbi:MAG: ABC transporter permease [Actinobacteria bacterium]|nr:ABC transporter permease [Actinomycetota bacterium]
MSGRRAAPSRSWEVFRALTVAELRDTRDLSVSGLVKWMLEPLSYMLIYFVLLASILNRARPNFMLYLLTALVPFRFFTGVTGSSMSVVTRFSQVLANVPVPKGILPPVVLATEGANFLVAIVMTIVPFTFIYGVDIWPSILWFPVVVGVLLVLTAGPAYIATVFGLYFADLRGVVQNLLRGGFFLSTALIPIRAIPGDQLPRLINANPLSGVFDSFRAVFVNGEAPRAIDLLYPLGVGLFLLLVGAVLFRWRQRHFPKEV